MVDVILSIDNELIGRVRRKAEVMGTSVNELVQGYLERLCGEGGSEEEAAEFERLSRLAQGDGRGWKFNREELHQRS